MWGRVFDPSQAGKARPAFRVSGTADRVVFGNPATTGESLPSFARLDGSETRPYTDRAAASGGDSKQRAVFDLLDSYGEPTIWFMTSL